MVMEDSFRAIRGELPKKRDVADWSETTLQAYCLFVNHFLYTKEREGRISKVLRVTEEKLKVAKERSDWEQFMARLLPPNEECTNTRLMNRLILMNNTVVKYLKENSWKLTDNLITLMKGNPRLEPAMVNYRAQETKIGAEVVVEDKFTGAFPFQPKNPEVLYATSMLKLASIAEDLLKNINQRDLKKMGAKSRIALALQIVSTLSRTYKEYKPNALVFKQLNIHASGRDDLEKALLDFSEQTK